MPRKLHIHVEEPSMEAFLRELLPRFLARDLAWQAVNYGSKQQLLARLPKRMMGYAAIPAEHRPLSLVLVDRDDDDCVGLKRQIEMACQAAGLHSRTRPDATGCFDVVSRIVIEELEAWFFGDAGAVEQGWSGSGKALRKAAYRAPDAIRGGTHEAFLRVLQGAGHLRGLDRLPKIDVARIMGGLLTPDANISPSFRQFWTGLHALVINGQRQTNG